MYELLALCVTLHYKPTNCAFYLLCYVVASLVPDDFVSPSQLELLSTGYRHHIDISHSRNPCSCLMLDLYKLVWQKFLLRQELIRSQIQAIDPGPKHNLNSASSLNYTHDS